MRILCRYVLAWMGALGIMNVYFCRINLSTAMVAMVGVEKHSKPEPNTNTSHSQCPGPVQVEGEDQVFPEGEFSWTKKQQGLVTGSYYWGYATCQIPAAWLASKMGFRRVFGISMLLASLLTLLFPVAAKAHVYLALVARILLGIFHAVAFPAMTGCWGAWAPPLEKTQLQGIFWSGASFGTLVIFTLAGYIADNLGWEAVFYVTGGCSLVWVVGWFYLVYDTPAQHPRIDTEEREFIEKAIGEKNLDRTNLVTPWRNIFTSIPVWSIVLGHTASNWGNYTLNQQLPTYLSNVLRYSLSFNGILASLCYLLQWAVCVGASWATDQVRARGIMSTIHIRKLNTFIGLWVTGGCVVLAAYAGCHAELAVLLFALAAGLNLLTVPGCKSGTMDIAPDYSGIVFAVANTMGNIPGFVAPTVVGFLLTDYSSSYQWYGVFWISATIHMVGSLPYLLKGSDQLQDWAVPKEVQDSETGAHTNVALSEKEK